ncbi:MAG: hypothetical protein IKO20_04900 [Bacteroidaceae bacterium]|nr:hypothetical protein [Bacteroidaceae bacterium]
MNKPILHHIKKIEYCAAYHLKRAIILPAQSRALIKDVMPWQEIPIVGLAEVETTEEVENGTRLSTTKLTATLCKRFQIPTRHLAFRLTDVQNNQYFLGTSDSPYPLITQKENHEDKAATPTTHILSIQLTSENSSLEIL